MAKHTCSHLGEIATDLLDIMYRRGQRIERAFYRNKLIWFQILLKIIVGELPQKLHYTPNETIDYTGVQILGVWSNKSRSDVTAKCEFYPEQGSVIDPSTDLLGITVVKLPNKTTYVTGETVSYSGIRVLAIYADDHIEDITSECTFSVPEESVIPHVSLVGILVTELPFKVKYNVGDELDFTGVKVLAVYTNGRIDDVTSECTFAPLSADS